MPKTRTGNEPLMHRDEEIDRTFHRLKRAAKEKELTPFKQTLEVLETSTRLNISPTILQEQLEEVEGEVNSPESAASTVSIPEEFFIPICAMANNQTLRQLSAPDLTTTPLCITLPTAAENESVELKFSLINSLPHFHGMKSEDANKHLAEYHAVCTHLKPKSMTDDKVLMKTFQFSLKDAAKDWFFYLPTGSITTWLV